MDQTSFRHSEDDATKESAHLRQRAYDAELSAERAMALLNAADEHHRSLEKRLRRSQNDLQSLTETIQQLVWRSQNDGDWTGASPQWTAYTGQSEAQSHGLGWLHHVHPDDRDRTLAAWHAAEAVGTLEVDHRLRRASDGAYRWFQTRATPLRDASRQTIEWFGTSTDVHEFRALQERHSLLLAELQHQVRNTLALVRVMAQGLAKTSDSVEGYADQLDDRLTALSRVLSAATRDPKVGTDLECLVAEELSAQLVREDEQVEIAGPPVLLPSKIAQTMGLAIYELATNAVEHGALTKPNGRVKISWSREQDQAGTHLVFEWAEMNLFGRVAQPNRMGSGIQFLEQTLVERLKAVITMVFAPPGLRCTIRVPLTSPTAAT